MAKTREQKAVVIDKLKDALKDAASSVFVHFTKITVAEESAMRRALRKEGVSYVVAKKTLIRRALDKLGHPPAPGKSPASAEHAGGRQTGKHDGLNLIGEVAIAYGGLDSTVAARLVHEFGKKLTDPFDKLRTGKLTILGGLFEGKLVDQAHMQEIATIPSMATSRAMFAQIINSPRQRFTVVLSKVAEEKQ